MRGLNHGSTKRKRGELEWIFWSVTGVKRKITGVCKGEECFRRADWRIQTWVQYVNSLFEKENSQSWGGSWEERSIYSKKT